MAIIYRKGCVGLARIVNYQIRFQYLITVRGPHEATVLNIVIASAAQSYFVYLLVRVGLLVINSSRAIYHNNASPQGLTLGPRFTKTCGVVGGSASVSSYEVFEIRRIHLVTKTHFSSVGSQVVVIGEVVKVPAVSA